MSATTEVRRSEGISVGVLLRRLEGSYMLLLEARIQRDSGLVHAFNHVLLHDGGIVRICW